MTYKNGELERIYQAILKDLDEWDGAEPLEDFVAKILQKRLCLNEEESRSVTEQLLSGIGKYKEAKKFVLNNPEIVNKVLEHADKGLLKKVVDELLILFKSVKRSFKDGN